MNKVYINYIIDMLLGLAFLSSFITGLMKFPAFHPLLGFPHANISQLHDWSGLILGILVLIHLILHYKWIVCMTKSIVRRKKCDME
jgi:hypothetical protein